ncbi:sperm-associated antigen 11A-like [Tursiops truncatus]|uniref:Sperm-associated antigen 11-like n=1 Tax=Tursiops truncatus TaxID=9739 RepID=A0A6J3QQQ1_TURTR|nr:sperm-associated antigen 11-like [Tursiops truncatus]
MASESTPHLELRYCARLFFKSGDIPPAIRNVICLMQHGTCRLFFCYAGEKKAEICSDPWNRCCIPHTEEEKINK